MLRAPFGNVRCRNVRRSNEISALGSAQTVAPMSQGLRGLVLLAAIASQLNDPQARLYFAIAGAVLLAVVSFVTSRLLTGAQITNWVRARTASEALKRETYKYAASAAPYDDPLKRDAALQWRT